MKFKYAHRLIYSAVALFVVPDPIHAQTQQSQCAAAISNPLQALVGSWAYSTKGFVPATAAFASAGQFVAAIGTKSGSPVGVLVITQTSSANGQITRTEMDSGTYQIFPDCSGGTLTFNLSSNPLTFDFWFANGGSEIKAASNLPGTTLGFGGKRVGCLPCFCVPDSPQNSCPCCRLIFTPFGGISLGGLSATGGSSK